MLVPLIQGTPATKTSSTADLGTFLCAETHHHYNQRLPSGAKQYPHVGMAKRTVRGSTGSYRPTPAAAGASAASLAAGVLRHGPRRPSATSPRPDGSPSPLGPPPV